MTKQLIVGDAAPQGNVINIDDKSLALESLWADGPTFLTFLRHFG